MSTTHRATDDQDVDHSVTENQEYLRQILNNTSAVVYVRDKDERFLLINQPFERVFNITQEAIVGKTLDEVFPPETAAQFRANDIQVFEQNTVKEFEETATLDDGVHTYISIKFPLYDSAGNIFAVCGISTDITRRKQYEQALHQAALGIAEASGEDVFNTLAIHLTKALGTDAAFIGVLENGQIRARAFYAYGRLLENKCYPLASSPSEKVVGKQFRFYPDSIQQSFPEDTLLKELGAESYAAIPLFDATGNVLGLLAVFHGQPLSNKELTGSILRIFSGRAVSELERERSDAALRASEASYRAIFEASEDCIFVHDIDTGAILDVNPKTCQVYGYNKAEMREIDVGDLSSGIPPYTREGAGKLIGRAIAGERLRFEWHRKNRDGSLHWDEVFLRRATIGGQDRILAFTREITERKEAEEKLRASEMQYREANRKLRESETFKSAVVDNALLSVITIDETGTVVEFNPAAVNMFGYDRNHAIGRKLTDMIIPEIHRKAHSEGLQRYLRTGEAQVLGKRLELTALHADGGEFPVELSISVSHIGDARYFTAFIADLTEKRRAEAALRASEEQYRSIFNTTSDAMILWSEAGEIVDLNPATWLMGGFTREEFLALPIDQHMHHTSRHALAKFKSAVTQGRSIHVEAQAIRKDGTIMYVDTRTVPMRYRGRQHVLSVSRDITEQKQAEEQLAKQREALRQSEKMSAMGELLAGVAHELNNPLAILIGRAALLQSKTLDPAVTSEVEKIKDVAERCGRIVRTFLAMAKQKPPERRSTTLNDVVKSALNLLGYSLNASGIELETNLAEDLPQQKMDVDQVGQVLINLLVNAQQALAQQAEPRCISIETGTTNGDTFCRVADNGPGVSEDLRQQIFDPFFTTKPGSMGTGIGLSVSRGIAREHGGELRLQQADNGALFELRLPLRADSQNESPARELTQNHARETRVLIVDDEPEMTKLLEDILRSAGLDTARVGNGRDAIQWLEANHCDLILSDIRMPDMDGPALWRILKQRHPELARRVAFITGDTLSAGVAPFLKETGQPWLEKPFTPEQVLELIARIEGT